MNLTPAGLHLCLTLVGASNPTVDECELRLTELLETRPRPFATIVMTDTPVVIPNYLKCIQYATDYQFGAYFCWRPGKMTFDPELGVFK